MVRRDTYLENVLIKVVVIALREVMLVSNVAKKDIYQENAQVLLLRLMVEAAEEAEEVGVVLIDKA